MEESFTPTRLVRGGKTTNLNNLLFLKYQLDNSANVTRIIDYRQAGQRQCFDYDDVGRLTVALTGNDQCTTVDKDRGEAQYDVGFEYTASGNLRRRVDTVAKTNWWYTYPSGTHRVTRAGTHTLGYDGNGAMTPRTVSGVIQMLDYDKAHRLTGITGGGDTTRRVHAADYVGAEHRAISLWGLLRNPSYGPSVAAEIVFVQWFPRVERSLFQRLFQDPW